MSYQDKIDQAHWEEHMRNESDERTRYCPRERVADESSGLVGQIAQLWGFVLTDQERDLVRVAYHSGGSIALDLNIIAILNGDLTLDVSEIADAIEAATDLYWDGDVFRPMPCPLMAHNEYPHEPGYLYDCEACESSCHCTPGNAECVWSGHSE